MSLKNKTAIITGGGRGIGKALALGFAQEGAQVIIAARTEKEITAVVDVIQKNGGQALAAVCDVANEEDVKNMVDAALDKFGTIDVLINNAGIGNVRRSMESLWKHSKKFLTLTLLVLFFAQSTYGSQ